MDEAKQSFCVLAGGKEFLRDSMVAAMLSKNQVFPTVNLLVVPVITEVETAKGFGPKSMSYEGEGYVAAPVDVRTTMQCVFIGEYRPLRLPQDRLLICFPLPTHNFCV